MLRHFPLRFTNLRKPAPAPSRLPSIIPFARIAIAPAWLALIAAILVPLLSGGKTFAAQASATTNQTNAPAHKVTQPRTHKAAPSHHSPGSPVGPKSHAVAAVPAAPPAPVWPVDQKPVNARVFWDSHGLKVEASNSSLDQILHEISTDTGVSIEGFSKDQRIFGTYGPGPAREVLSRLLDGSGYNVLMIGGEGDAPPIRIVLTASTPSGPQAQPSAQNSAEDEEAEEPPPPPEQPQPQPPQIPRVTPQPTPIRNPFGNGVPGFGFPTPQPPTQQPEQQNAPQQQ